MFKKIVALFEMAIIFAIALPETKALSPTPQEKTASQSLHSQVTSPDQLTIPQLLNYQGKLTDINGTPVRDSLYSITFQLYTSPSGGTSFWSETQSVQTQAGLFNVLLGSVTPISALPLDGNCYLEMKINPNPAMTPRIRITSSAYAFLAKKADSANFAPLTRPIIPPIITNEIADNAVNSAKIFDGSVSRQDVTVNFKAPYADTADFARVVNVPFVDSAQVAANAYKLQGNDISALDLRYVNENQANAISGAMIKDSSVTSAKIFDGTIQLIDLAFTPVLRPITPGVSTQEISDNAVSTNKLEDGAVTNAKVAVDAITSDKILDNTITRADVITTFKAPYADTADFSRAVNVQYVDSARIATDAYKLQGNDISALDNRYVNEGQNNSVTGSMIANDAVTTTKILDQTIIGSDIAKPLILEGSVTWPNAILRLRNNGTGRAISIDSAGFVGLYVNYSFTDGVNIRQADAAGVLVDTSGGAGVRILSAGTDGIGIDAAGYNGVYIMYAWDNGIKIDSAESYGVFGFGNYAGGNFAASNPEAQGLIAHSYENSATDTALQVYGQGYATGGFYTGGLFGDKSAPCLISPELGIITAGTGILTNGKAEIYFDPLFTENIRTDIPIRITVTPKGKPAGFLYVSETKAHGFNVEMQAIPGLENNSSELTFDWMAFGTLKQYQTSPSAQSQWQKMQQERVQYQNKVKTERAMRNYKP